MNVVKLNDVSYNLQEALLKNTSLTALGGIITALSVFIMFLAGIIPNMTYVIPELASILLIVTTQEADLKWSVFIYAAVSLLSFFIVADKEAVTMYVFFIGYYPILKEVFDHKLKQPLRILCKLLVFNAATIVAYLVIIYVFLIPMEGMGRFGKYTPWILLGIGNVAFLLYDWMLSALIRLYQTKIHPKIGKIFKT